MNRRLCLLIGGIMLIGCSRHPAPEAPGIPDGPISAQPHVPHTYTVAVDCPDEQWMSCRLDWGDGTTSQWSCYVLDGAQYRFTHEWESCGSYAVSAQTKGEDERLSAWSESLSVTIRQNRPPVVTSGPVGPRVGTKGTEYQYAVTASDSDRNRVRVRIDWGDGSVSPWTAARSGRDAFELAHAWQTTGHYGIRAQARDTKGQESEWSPDSDVIICVATTGWHQQVTVNPATGVPEFNGSNPNGNLGALGGTFTLARYPEFGGYMWELVPGSSDVRYEHLDLTGYYGADSLRVEWSCHDGRGGQATFQVSVNDRVTATCTNPDSFNMCAWRWRVGASRLNWGSSDNYVRLLRPSGADGTLLVTRMEFLVFGAWTTDRGTSPAHPALEPSESPPVTVK